MIGQGNRTGSAASRLETRSSEVPKSGNNGTSRSSRGLSGWIIRRLKPVCHPCKEGNDHAKGYSAGQKDPW